MATHYSILAWKIPWMDEPGGVQFTGLQSRTQPSIAHTTRRLPKFLAGAPQKYRVFYVQEAKFN